MLSIIGLTLAGTAALPQSTCTGTGTFVGCRGNSCAVCTEKVSSYPYYFINHIDCEPNSTCAGEYFNCNLACPAPTSADLQCNGTSGEWSGCRGNGCAVCSEKVSGYACYFQNHPNCQPNDTCGGEYFTCNAHCPTPTAADIC